MKVHGIDVKQDSILKSIEMARAAGGIIVMTNGCFDLLHVGHVRSLQEARSLGTHLVVAVNNDESVRRLKGEDRPIVSLADRVETLQALRPVDWVLTFGSESDDTPKSVVEKVRPDVLAKGGDYSLDEIVGSEFVRSYGGVVKALNFHDSWSTSKTIEHITSIVRRRKTSDS